MPGQVALVASPGRARAIDIPVVGSLAVRRAVTGPRQDAVLLGTTSGALYLRGQDGTLLALLAPEAARLPLGLVVGAAADLRRFADAAAGTVRIGRGSVDFGAVTARVVRWWDPRLRLGVPVVTVPVGPSATSAAALAALTVALRTPDRSALGSAAVRLAGLGPGLTPAADDVLIGLQSALTCFGHPLSDVLPGAVRGRTTDLSQALVEHAADGCYLGEVGAVLRAVAGRGDPERAVARLRAVGQSSGPAILTGLAIGVAAHQETRRSGGSDDGA